MIPKFLLELEGTPVPFEGESPNLLYWYDMPMLWYIDTKDDKKYIFWTWDEQQIDFDADKKCTHWRFAFVVLECTGERLAQLIDQKISIRNFAESSMPFFEFKSDAYSTKLENPPPSWIVGKIREIDEQEARKDYLYWREDDFL